MKNGLYFCHMHLLEFAFWTLWVTAVLRNILSKDPTLQSHKTRPRPGGVTVTVPSRSLNAIIMGGLPRAELHSRYDLQSGGLLSHVRPGLL